MNTKAALLALSLVAASTQARVIHEDFRDDAGGPAFNPELTFDFGTATDFTGGADTHDLFAGELWLYADLVTVSVNSLAADEYIESVEVSWTDFCGVGCTIIQAVGATSNLALTNTVVGSTEIRSISSMDLGENIEFFRLSSFEGRMNKLTINVVPSPSALGMLGLGGLFAARRRR
jgi:hypothetical protein